MAVVAGIDEAGYGPLLGPLVVSAAAFRVRDEAGGADLWDLFSSVITREAPRKTGRLQVADSKVVHRGPNGPRALEENLLPFLGLLWPLPGSVRGLMRNLRCENAQHIGGYPWYRDCDPGMPRRVKAEHILERSRDLQAKLAAAGAAFCGARTEALDVAEFNREVRKAGCKSVPLARRVAVLMAHLWETLGEEKLVLFVDKQGGRNRYSSFLRAAFPGCRLEVYEETAGSSGYRISAGGRQAAIQFEPRADSRRLPVALASMLSKYVRELFVEMLNEFWRRRVPGLRPTAGYIQDGRRFLADIEAARAAEGISLDLLARCR